MEHVMNGHMHSVLAVAMRAQRNPRITAVTISSSTIESERNGITQTTSLILRTESGDSRILVQSIDKLFGMGELISETTISVLSGNKPTHKQKHHSFDIHASTVDDDIECLDQLMEIIDNMQ